MATGQSLPARNAQLLDGLVIKSTSSTSGDACTRALVVPTEACVHRTRPRPTKVAGRLEQGTGKQVVYNINYNIFFN